MGSNPAPGANAIPSWALLPTEEPFSYQRRRGRSPGAAANVAVGRVWVEQADEFLHDKLSLSIAGLGVDGNREILHAAGFPKSFSRGRSRTGLVESTCHSATILCKIRHGLDSCGGKTEEDTQR